MGIKLSKQTTTEPYPESYHGSSTRFTKPKDNWILVQSSKLKKMKDKLKLRKDPASVTPNTFNTRDPKECMANTSNPTRVSNIDNSALYAYKVNKVCNNFKAKYEQPKKDKKRKVKKCKRIDKIKQNKQRNSKDAWNLMDIQDMHEFIKHLNYTIVLLDLIKEKATPPVHSTNVTYECNKFINKHRKTNKNNTKVRPNKHHGNTTKTNQAKQLDQVRPNMKTYPSKETKEHNQKSVEPKKGLKTTYSE